MKDVGEMMERVNFMYPLTSQSTTTGEKLKTWVTSNAVWTKMEYRRVWSDEIDKTGRKTETTKVVFSMYYNSSVKPTWRVKYGSREFEIESVLPDHDNMFMEIEAVNTEPWRNEYSITASAGLWTDSLGNYWATIDRGETKPTFGNLTWTDSNDNTWTTA